jgi:hypothetical protein
MKRLTFDQDKIIAIGDVHGEFRPLNYQIHKRYRIENSLLIQVGDFGIGFFGEKYDEYSRYSLDWLNVNLIKNNNFLVVIRGNHDNPSYFDGEFGRSNIKLVEDYTLLETKLGRILCVGGAASIDKSFRVEGQSWWKDELPVYNLDKLLELEKEESIDYVLAHSNPERAYPTNKLHFFGKEVDEYIKQSRQTLDKIYQFLSNHFKIKKWINGHFHFNHSEIIKDTEFISIDIMEFYELK